MPSPQFLIIVPLILSGITLIIRRWSKATVVVGTLGILFLGITLATISLDGNQGIITGEPWNVFGRTLSLADSDRGALLFIVGGMGFLILLTMITPQSSVFIPLCLALISPIAGALMVRPFVFGAVLILMTAAGVSVMIQDEKAGSTLASWRHLAIFALAPPLLLISGWMLETDQTRFMTEISSLIALATIILLIGFPFHIWAAPTSDESRALVMVVAFGLVQLAVVIFCTNLIRSNMAILLDPQFTLLMRSSGIIAVVLAAFLALISQSLGRAISYLLLFDVGVTLYALGLGTISGLNLAIVSVLLRIIAVFLVAIGLGAIRKYASNHDQDNSAVKTERNFYFGVLYVAPVKVILAVYGMLSLIGFPATPGFLGRWVFLSQASQQSTTAAIIILAAMIICLCGVLRWCLRFVKPRRGHVPNKASPYSPASIVASVTLVLALLMALFPRWLEPIISGISVP